MSKPAPLQLAAWIRRRYPYRDALSHLKLQKLVFYAYGFGASAGFRPELGDVAFEPWQHGPVCRAVWHAYKGYGSGTIPADDLQVEPPRAYGAEAEHVLENVLVVYGLLDAWSLREESHTEAPWKAAFAAKAPVIDDAAILAHFEGKSGRANRFSLPRYLFDRGSYSLDGAHVVDFDDLAHAARALKTVFPSTS